MLKVDYSDLEIRMKKSCFEFKFFKCSSCLTSQASKIDRLGWTAKGRLVVCKALRDKTKHGVLKNVERLTNQFCTKVFIRIA